MTSRLVALMSFVLLLSLAAFALLLGHVHARVMDEVPRTVSVVGRETIRWLEGRRPEAWFAFATATAGADQPAPAPGVDVREVDGEVERVARLRLPGAPPAPGGAGGQEPRRIVIVHEEQTGGGGDPGASRVTRFTVNLAGVRAEDDPAHGLRLRIPAAAPGAAGMPASFAFAAALPLGGHDILLPIPAGDYGELFAAARRRSLLVFLAVLALGVALSWSLASRFTRPIRALDQAIRRLGEGDLEAAVAATGNDEVARLARAFNDMAARLLAGRDRERELRRREKLAALGRLAAGVAHDVRSPLHAINLTLQHLKETARPGEPSRAAEFERGLGLIRAELGRLDQLVSSFLLFARSEPGARQGVALGELLRETARLVEGEAARRGIAVELEIEPELPEVRGEPGPLRASILNLVLNSFDATPAGGRVTLAARRAGDGVAVEVADTGCGIPAEEQERVFDFAYTTRDGGHGLGLAMVHHVVVEGHGGRVSLRSRPGEGTRVLLALPAAP